MAWISHIYMGLPCLLEHLAHPSKLLAFHAAPYNRLELPAMRRDGATMEWQLCKHSQNSKSRLPRFADVFRCGHTYFATRVDTIWCEQKMKYEFVSVRTREVDFPVHELTLVNFNDTDLGNSCSDSAGNTQPSLCINDCVDMYILTLRLIPTAALACVASVSELHEFLGVFLQITKIRAVFARIMNCHSLVLFVNTWSFQPCA